MASETGYVRTSIQTKGTYYENDLFLYYAAVMTKVYLKQEFTGY